MPFKLQGLELRVGRCSLPMGVCLPRPFGCFVASHSRTGCLTVGAEIC